MSRKSLLFGIVALVTSPFTLGLSNANAFCVQLVNFCDQMEVFVDIDGNAYGRWDWRCDGLDLEEMLGEGESSNVVAGYLAGVAKTESWRFNVPARTVDIWQFLDGGVTPPSLLVPAGQPFNVAGTTCVFGAGPNAGLPAVND